MPDKGSLEGAERAIALTSSMQEGQHLLVLLSGGGSALMAKPIGRLSLEDKQDINAALLASGQDIHRMNAVRRLFSAVKGGRLAAMAAPARVTQWVLSDVPGDHLASIASGPFAPDPWSFDDACICVREAGIDRHDWAQVLWRRCRKGIYRHRCAPAILFSTALRAAFWPVMRFVSKRHKRAQCKRQHGHSTAGAHR